MTHLSLPIDFTRALSDLPTRRIFCYIVGLLTSHQYARWLLRSYMYGDGNYNIKYSLHFACLHL